MQIAVLEGYGDTLTEVANAFQTAAASVGSSTPVTIVPSPGLFEPGGWVDEHQTTLLLIGGGFAGYMLLRYFMKRRRKGY